MESIRIDADIIEKAVRLRHELHENAELSRTEERTKRIITEFITENTRLEPHDMGAWCYFAYRASGGGKRRIAFRADMDALPIDEGTGLEYCSKTRGVSHKCGHDGHSAALAAFALTVDRYGSDNDIFFLFQHAEETGEGAAECERLIALEAVDEIYGWHNMPGFPVGSVAVHTGVAACASRGLMLRFTGKNSHASQPENGKNPAFAVASFISGIPSAVLDAAGEGARELVPGSVMGKNGIVMCTVVGAEIGSRETGGTEAFGTSAGFARVMLTLRAEDESRLDALHTILTENAETLAEKHGLSTSFEVREPFPETRNDDGCAEKVRRAARELGIEIARWDEPFRSSEDFGRYTKLTRGALFYIGCGLTHAPLHTAGYDFEDEIIDAAVRLMLRLASLAALKR